MPTGSVSEWEDHTDLQTIDRHAFERFLIADCAQSATCNVYALEHNSGVPGVLSTNPARSSTSRMSARQLTGWLTPRAPVRVAVRPNLARVRCRARCDMGRSKEGRRQSNLGDLRTSVRGQIA